MSMCRTFLKAYMHTATPKARKAMAGAAVLGEPSIGYTVELRDGSQIHVGRTCCKYCARVEALSVIGDRLDRGAPLCDYAKATGEQ